MPLNGSPLVPTAKGNGSIITSMIHGKRKHMIDVIGLGVLCLTSYSVAY